jgi:hypothetical protein
MTTLTPQEQELMTLFTERLPQFIDDHPELEPQLYHVFLKTFARKEEVAAVRQEVAEFREETREQFARTNTRIADLQTEVRENFSQVDKRFEQVDKRFEQADKRITDLQTEVREGFARATKDMQRSFDRFGARWGIRSEELFRETMASVLEKSFGAKVETRSIKGEQFDLIISNGEHILVEITASAKRNALERLTRKRQLYTQEIGVTPARFIFAVAVINARRLQLLREAGFEVIVPDDELEETDNEA